MLRSLVGSEMCIRDRSLNASYMRTSQDHKSSKQSRTDSIQPTTQLPRAIMIIMSMRLHRPRRMAYCWSRRTAVYEGAQRASFIIQANTITITTVVRARCAHLSHTLAAVNATEVWLRTQIRKHRSAVGCAPTSIPCIGSHASIPLDLDLGAFLF